MGDEAEAGPARGNLRHVVLGQSAPIMAHSTLVAIGAQMNSASVFIQAGAAVAEQWRPDPRRPATADAALRVVGWFHLSPRFGGWSPIVRSTATSSVLSGRAGA